ncbi:Splicing factor spf30 [Sphaceloma murrayae]|uniref:Splicing factor spf30 n=1 Tax=Sphaceloma murrayae TaxID=2082308 RepID=A0A2K1QIQ4_9PEZI|nr:Splicing factor spf30 [Sphaceloma murrayae]
MPSLAELQAQLALEDANLTEANEILELMPDNEDAIDIKHQVLARKKDLEDKIAQLSNHRAAPALPAKTTPVINASENTPKTVPDEERRIFKIGENVTAKYAGDGQWYPATITSVQGSSSNPIYTIKFKGYDEQETIPAHRIRAQAHSNPLKRKADDVAAVSSPAPTGLAAPNGSVLSAPANIDGELASQLKKDQNKALDADALERPKKKKVNKAAQALEKGKSNWQDFKSKSAGSKVGKAVNKESMFRTGDNPLAKVGFVGSGKTMTKDVVKGKHKYEALEDDRGDRYGGGGGYGGGGRGYRDSR